jgi:Alpha galactosidase C-terminal beta sandwich domain
MARIVIVQLRQSNPIFAMFRDFHQGLLGRQGQRNRDYGDAEVWRKQLAGKTEAYLLLNRSESTKEISVYVGKDKRVRDLWKHEDLGPFDDGFFRARVAPHGVVMVKVLSR